MAKVRPASAGKKKAGHRSSLAGAIPCLFLVFGGILLLGFLFLQLMKG